MSNINIKSVRNQKIHIAGGTTQPIYFSDTKPNFANIQNLSSQATLNIGTKGNVNASIFEIQIISGGKRTYTNPLGFTTLYIYSDVDADIIVMSGEGDVSTQDLPQTQQTVLITQNVPVNVGINGSLPAGTNHIGAVTIDNSSLNEIVTAPLPAGTNNIGGVNIENTPNVNIVYPIFKAQKVTLTAGIDNTVKGSAGMVLSIQTSLTDLILKNNNIEIWKGNCNFAVPITLDTNIVLNSATGGDTYIVYA